MGAALSLMTHGLRWPGLQASGCEGGERVPVDIARRKELSAPRSKRGGPGGRDRRATDALHMTEFS